MSLYKRITEIDIAKGILIFFVILGHSPIDNWLASCIGSFHMAAFFCLSGFTYNYGVNLREFMAKKTMSLLIPYIRFCVILLLLATLKHILHIGLDNYNLLSGIESIFFPYSGRYYTTVYFLWFLPCLFMVESLMAFSQYVSARFHNPLMGGAILLFCSMACIIFYALIHVPSIISIFPIGLLFFLIGVYGKPFLKEAKSHSWKVIPISFFLFLVTFYCNTHDNGYHIDLSSMHLGYWCLYVFTSFFGTLLTLSISSHISSSLIQWIGKNSIYYYGLHFCTIWIVDSFTNGIVCAILTLFITTPLVLGYKKMFC